MMRTTWLLGLQGLGLAVDPSKPMIIVVSRLVGQKNPALMQVGGGGGRACVWGGVGGGG
jgi:hypothetical protein